MTKQANALTNSRRLLFIGLMALLPALPGAALAQDATEAPENPSPGQILVWVEDAPSPRENSPAVEGVLGRMDMNGEVTGLGAVPPQTNRVTACGDEALSPDGSRFAYFVGIESGDLSMIASGGAPALLENVNALTCLGSGTFQYSPDSTRLAYIAFEADAAASEFADGLLRVVSVGDLAREFSYENVVAFDINDSGAGLVSFFTNERGEADEAAILWWDGSAEREVATLNPDADCRYTAATVGIAPDERLVVLLGHRCQAGDVRTSWQLHVIDVAARSATLAASDFAAGAFASFAQTSAILFSADGRQALFTLPDGVTANTAALVAVDLDTLAVSTLIERQIVMPTFSGAPNAYPALSPDGRWFAFVVTSPNNENTLTVLDLTNPAGPPLMMRAGSPGDLIADMRFSADSQHIIAIAGAEANSRDADNSLMQLDLATGSNLRIQRGRFASGLALSPDGTMAAVQEYQAPDDPREPLYLNLLTINLDSGAAATLFEGATIADGKVTQQRFAHPLIWQP